MKRQRKMNTEPPEYADLNKTIKNNISGEIHNKNTKRIREVIEINTT